MRPVWRAALARLSLSLAGLALGLLLAEFLARALGLGGPPRFFVKDASGDAIQTLRYQKSARLPIRMQPQSFAARKPAGSLRIFCFGGSTVFGYPFGPEGTFPNFMRALLRAGLPERRVSVINAGFTGGDSARVLALMREAAEYEPDAFVVYSGQNEFLRFEYPDEADRIAGFNPSLSLPMRLRVAAWLDRSVFLRAASFSWHAWRGSAGTARSGHVAGEELEAVYRSYEANLEDMAAFARSRGVPLVLCTVVSNLRTLRPLAANVPEELLAAQRQTLARERETAYAELAAGRHDLARAAAGRGRAISPEDPDLAYVSGRALLAAGDTAGARRELQASLEQDGLRHRAPQRINAAVRAVAARRGVPLCDLLAAFEARSPSGMVGEEWLLDHVHPNLEGLMLMAREIVRALAGSGLMPDVSAGLNDEQLAGSVKLTLPDWRLGTSRLAVSAEARGSHEAAAGLFEQAARMFGPARESSAAQAEASYLRGLAALVLGRGDEARGLLEEARATDPRTAAILDQRFAQLDVARRLARGR
jgi:lysophospholipase L1-like esterase